MNILDFTKPKTKRAPKEVPTTTTMKTVEQRLREVSKEMDELFDETSEESLRRMDFLAREYNSLKEAQEKGELYDVPF